MNVGIGEFELGILRTRMIGAARAKAQRDRQSIEYQQLLARNTFVE
ncbi:MULTISPECIES: hypothetical protein [Rhizobium]|nr:MULTISPECIES: hypothetical protein [Rhizobium]